VHLLRHGIAVDSSEPGCPPDPERPLTERGARRTRAAALGLRWLGISPDVALTSPLLRAVQTADIAAKILRIPRRGVRRTETLLPGADPAETLLAIRRIRATSVLCVGHAPNLDGLLAGACGLDRTFTELKKAGVAALDLSARSARLVFLLEPRALRRLA
jgi:phosphohistidine phosphatase